jgi:hypothetical protein
MKIHQSGRTASVTLTRREAQALRRGHVPMVYAPGGQGPLGPDMPPPGGGTVPFTGPWFLTTEANLRAALAAFQSAMQAELKRQDDVRRCQDPFPLVSHTMVPMQFSARWGIAIALAGFAVALWN